MRVFIGVGTNLGDRELNLRTAERFAFSGSELTLRRKSFIYETDPVGGPEQGKYLNAVWEGETKLSPENLLDLLLEVEARMGRQRTVPNAPRIIDLDILFYEDRIIQQPGLAVPHSRLQERFFVLKPLVDIAPDFRHPVLKKTMSQLLEECLAGNYPA